MMTLIRRNGRIFSQSRSENSEDGAARSLTSISGKQCERINYGDVNNTNYRQKEVNDTSYRENSCEKEANFIQTSKNKTSQLTTAKLQKIENSELNTARRMESKESRTKPKYFDKDGELKFHWGQVVKSCAL